MLILLTLSDDDRPVIQEIYDKHYKHMLYAATQILGSQRGEEAVHDVFVNLMEKYEDDIASLGDKPRSFFVIVTRNYSIDLIKKAQVKIVSLSDELEDSDSDIFQTPVTTEDIILEHEAADRLLKLIGRFKADTQRILEYKFIMGYTNKEIAEIFGISQSAVSTRVDKAKKKLRKILESEEVTKKWK